MPPCQQHNYFLQACYITLDSLVRIVDNSEDVIDYSPMIQLYSCLYCHYHNIRLPHLSNIQHIHIKKQLVIAGLLSGNKGEGEITD